MTALITVTGGYWWNVIIPAKRTELAISKRKGKYEMLLKSIAIIIIIRSIGQNIKKKRIHENKVK